MRVEYKAITDAGLILQMEQPDLPDAGPRNPRKWMFLPIAASQRSRGARSRPAPTSLSSRFHPCWGSYKGPHRYDIP